MTLTNKVKIHRQKLFPKYSKPKLRGKRNAKIISNSLKSRIRVLKNIIS